MPTTDQGDDAPNDGEAEQATTDPLDVVDAETFDGIMAVLKNERAATSDESRVAGSIAYDAELYDGGPNQAEDALMAATYTVGPRAQEKATAANALLSLAYDALNIETADGEVDSFDVSQERVREAIEAYATEYGQTEISDALRGFVISLRAHRAFDRAGVDPRDVVGEYDR